MQARTGNPRQWLSEASGLVPVTPSSGPQLACRSTRRPVLRRRRRPRPPFLNVGKGTSAKINIAGEGVNTGAEPLGYLSKVSAFELGIESGQATLGTGGLGSPAVLTSSTPGAATKGTSVYFGFSTFADWAAPATDVQFNVQIDRNNDGAADVQAFTTRFTTGPNADPLDVFVVGVGTPGRSRSRTSSTRT